MFKDPDPFNKNKRKVGSSESASARKPDIPVKGPGKGGKLGTNFTQHFMQGVIKDTTREEDPREAILRHAAEADCKFEDFCSCSGCASCFKNVPGSLLGTKYTLCRPIPCLFHYSNHTANPYWVAPAYKKNQPMPVMAANVYEDEDEAQRAAKKKRPQ
jgi:hypothetical protein